MVGLKRDKMQRYDSNSVEDKNGKWVKYEDAFNFACYAEKMIEKSANSIWDFVSGMLTQEQIDLIHKLHEDDLDTIGII